MKPHPDHPFTSYYYNEACNIDWASIHLADNRKFAVATNKYECKILDEKGIPLDIDVVDIRLPMPLIDEALVWIYDGETWNFLRCCYDDNGEFMGLHYYKSNFCRYESFIVDKWDDLERYYFNFGVIKCDKTERYVLITPNRNKGNLRRDKLNPANYEGNMWFTLSEGSDLFDIANCEMFDEIVRINRHLLKVRRGNHWGVLFFLSDWGCVDDGVKYIEPIYQNVSLLYEYSDHYIFLVEKEGNFGLESKFGLVDAFNETECIYDTIYLKDNLIVAKKDGKLFAISRSDFFTVELSSIDFSQQNQNNEKSFYRICRCDTWWGYLDSVSGNLSSVYQTFDGTGDINNSGFEPKVSCPLRGNLTAFWTGSFWGIYCENGVVVVNRNFTNVDFFKNDLEELKLLPVFAFDKDDNDLTICDIYNFDSFYFHGRYDLPNPEFTYTVLSDDTIIAKGFVQFESFSFTVDLHGKPVPNGLYVVILEGRFDHGDFKKYEYHCVVDGTTVKIVDKDDILPF